MVEKKKYILKVRQSKSTKQKTITIPKKAEEIGEDDYVRVEKVEEDEDE